MDSVLALHLAAPGSNLGRDIFSLLLSVEIKATYFAKAVQRRPKPSTTKSIVWINNKSLESSFL